MPTLTNDDILDAIGNLTVLQLSELLKAFEEKFGVTAAAPVAVAGVAAPGGGEPAPVEEEQDEFDVVLIAAGEKKIQVIKEVRSLTSLAWHARQGRLRAGPLLAKSRCGPRRGIAAPGGGTSA